MNGVIGRLRQALLAGADGASDRGLLDAFLARRDEAAFAALVRRHGPMVLGVCRRVLRHEQDAEDAFQAAFVVLARRAPAVRAETLANWLHGVAYRTAMKAKVMTARRRTREQEIGRMPVPETRTDEPWRELLPLLDRELGRLPDKYRSPVVLCDLEGKSRKDAAGQLGVPEGTLSSRLNRARALLARRLTRHGPAASASAVALALTNEAPARVPARLLVSTVTAATGPTPAGIAALTEGVLKVMLLERLKVVTAVALAVALVGLGVAAACQAPPAGGPGAGPQEGLGGGGPVPPQRAGGGASAGVALPDGPMPTPAAVRLNDDGRVVVRTRGGIGMGGMMGPGPAAGGGGGFGPVPVGGGGIGGPGGGIGPVPAGPIGPGGGAPPGGFGGKGGGFPGAPGGAGGPGKGGAAGGAPGGVGLPGGRGGFGGGMRGGAQSGTTLALDAVRAFDGTGKRIPAGALARRLEKEVPALVYFHGTQPDPLHLRFLKADTLILVIPGGPGVPGMGGGRGGFGGAGPGGFQFGPGAAGPGGQPGGPGAGGPGLPGGAPPRPGAGGGQPSGPGSPPGGGSGPSS